MPPAAAPRSKFAEVEGLRLHYLEQGSGEPVLMLHGWPTSSYLWRGIVPAVGEGNRAIALDLPGFGRSDKPLDASYSFRFFERVLSGFLDAVGVERLGLAVHDLGGPVGLYWASQHPERVSSVALLNTLVFARPSWAVIAFVASARIPGIRSWLTSPAGIRFAMRYGVNDKSRLTDEAIRAYQEPFVTRRRAQGAAQGRHEPSSRRPEGGRALAARDRSRRCGSSTASATASCPTSRRRCARSPSGCRRPSSARCPTAGISARRSGPDEIGEALARFFGHA